MDPGSPNGVNDTSHRGGRQRLKPWLEAQINSGKYPGLKWIDQEKGIFRMTWKHSGRSDWCEEDGLIFKAWAVHTGRFREGIDEPDWPGWKTRLRCALNKMKPGIQKLKEPSCKEEPNPYCVYQFTDGKSSPGSGSPLSQSAQLAEESDSCSVDSQSPQRPSVIQPNIPSIIDELQVKPQTAFEAQVNSLGSDLLLLNTKDLLHPETSIPTSDISIDSNININSLSLAETMDTDSLKGAGCEQMDVQVKTEKPGLPDQMSISDYEMNVTVRFRTDVVLNTVIKNPQGCRLFYDDKHPVIWNTELFGVSTAEQYLIPYKPNQLSAEQAEWTSRVLDGLDLGISIFMQQRNIYVTRRCKTRIMTALPNQEEKIKTRKVDRLETLKIFDFHQDFLPAFIDFEKGEGPRPSSQVIMALGQNFKTNVEPYPDLLVSVTVSHAQASQLLAKHVIKTEPIQISLSNEFDNRMSFLKTQDATLQMNPMVLPHSQGVLWYS